MTPNVLAVHPDVPAKSVTELVALARSSRTRSPTGTVEAGNIPSISPASCSITWVASQFGRSASAGQQVSCRTCWLATISMCFCNIVTVLPLAQEGKLRALAVTSLKRSPTAPDLPTMDEAGFKGFDATAWFGLMAPAGTPDAIVGKLHNAVVKALASADVAAKFNALGMVAIGNTPAEFTTVIQAEDSSWERVIKTIGLKLK